MQYKSNGDANNMTKSGGLHAFRITWIYVSFTSKIEAIGDSVQ